MMKNIGNSVTNSNSNIININSSSTVHSTNVTSANAIELLKNMLAGDTFNGQIISINGNEIQLKLNDGKSLIATLLNNSQLTIGQNMTFMINEISKNKISIRPLLLNEQQTLLIGRALEASNLPINSRNVQLVKELLSQNMSIDINSLNLITKDLNKYPKADLETIVRLTKLNIPITEDNIKQFDAYKSFQHSITNDMNAFSKNFGDFLSNTLMSGDTRKVAELSQKFVDILYPANSNVPNIATNQTATIAQNNMPFNSPQDDSTKLQDGFESASNQGQATNVNSDQLLKFMNSTARNNLTQTLIDTFGEKPLKNFIQNISEGNITAKYILENINQLIKSHPDLIKDNLHHLLSSKEFTDIIKLIIRDNMKISPEDLKTSDNLKEYYKRVHDTLNSLSNQLENDKDTPLSKSLDAIKSNIEFMNELNKNMSYFQVPVKFSDRDAESELYVFTNKKSSKSNSDSLSALLHLTMDNLGAIDVFINLSGKNVSTNFCLESEDLLNFVYEHIDQLNNRLETLGYYLKYEMKVRENENPDIDFVQDFIDQNNNTSIPNQFIFDTKA